MTTIASTVLRATAAQPWFKWLALCGLAIAYVGAGIGKLTHFDGAQQEFAQLGLPFPALFVVVVIVTELLGSALLFTRRYAAFGALWLAGFTLVAALLAHRFWQAQPAAHAGEMNTFFEHLSLIGGFLFLAHSSAREGASS